MDNTFLKRRQALSNSESILEIQNLINNLKKMKTNRNNLVDLKMKVRSLKVKNIIKMKKKKRTKLNSMSSLINSSKHAL